MLLTSPRVTSRSVHHRGGSATELDVARGSEGELAVRRKLVAANERAAKAEARAAVLEEKFDAEKGSGEALRAEVDSLRSEVVEMLALMRFVAGQSGGDGSVVSEIDAAPSLVRDVTSATTTVEPDAMRRAAKLLRRAATARKVAATAHSVATHMVRAADELAAGLNSENVASAVRASANALDAMKALDAAAAATDGALASMNVVARAAPSMAVVTPSPSPPLPPLSLSEEGGKAVASLLLPPSFAVVDAAFSAAAQRWDAVEHGTELAANAELFVPTSRPEAHCEHSETLSDAIHRSLRDRVDSSRPPRPQPRTPSPCAAGSLPPKRTSSPRSSASHAGAMWDAMVAREENSESPFSGAHRPNAHEGAAAAAIAVAALSPALQVTSTTKMQMWSEHKRAMQSVARTILTSSSPPSQEAREHLAVASAFIVAAASGEQHRGVWSPPLPRRAAGRVLEPREGASLPTTPTTPTPGRETIDRHAKRSPEVWNLRNEIDGLDEKLRALRATAAALSRAENSDALEITLDDDRGAEPHEIRSRTEGGANGAAWVAPERRKRGARAGGGRVEWTDGRELHRDVLAMSSMRGSSEHRVWRAQTYTLYAAGKRRSSRPVYVGVRARGSEREREGERERERGGGGGGA